LQQAFKKLHIIKEILYSRMGIDGYVVIIFALKPAVERAGNVRINHSVLCPPTPPLASAKAGSNHHEQVKNSLPSTRIA
jgi:hypothetical protein